MCEPFIQTFKFISTSCTGKKSTLTLHSPILCKGGACLCILYMQGTLLRPLEPQQSHQLVWWLEVGMIQGYLSKQSDSQMSVLHWPSCLGGQFRGRHDCRLAYAWWSQGSTRCWALAALGAPPMGRTGCFEMWAKGWCILRWPAQHEDILTIVLVRHLWNSCLKFFC